MPAQTPATPATSASPPAPALKNTSLPAVKPLAGGVVSPGALPAQQVGAGPRQPGTQVIAPAGRRPLPPTYGHWPDGGPNRQQIEQFVNDARELGRREPELQQARRDIVTMMNNFDPLGERVQQNNAPPQTFTPAAPGQQQPAAPPTPTTSGQPAAASPPPASPPVAQPAPAQNNVTAAQPATKPFDNFEQTFQAAPREQQVQVAQQAVQQHMPNVPPEEQKGVQDLATGANTPEAKMFEQKVNETGQKVMQEQVDQQIQANPELAASPQGFGQLWNQASDMWNSMPQEAKWMVGLGIPLGAAGLMSSLFGEGGMAGGLLGLLGLGAAGLGAAGSGVLGQDAQNMTTDALYNVGTFFGAMPEKADFSALKGPDALQKLTAGPTTGEAASTWWDPKAKAQEVQGQLDQADQLGKLMMVPEGMRARLIQKMDTSLSPEEAQQIAANAAQAHTAMQDPESALAKKLQQGRDLVANPEGYVNQQAWNAVNPMNWFKSGSTNMDIQYLISRWAEKRAFNDVDAKEMADLKAQQSTGVPYRVEDARRLNALEKRQQAETPLKKEVVISVCKQAARCWAGYEPVPGAKAYSKGSCRPKGSKKTQKEMKKS